MSAVNSNTFKDDLANKVGELADLAKENNELPAAIILFSLAGCLKAGLEVILVEPAREAAETCIKVLTNLQASQN